MTEKATTDIRTLSDLRDRKQQVTTQLEHSQRQLNGSMNDLAIAGVKSAVAGLLKWSAQELAARIENESVDPDVKTPNGTPSDGGSKDERNKNQFSLERAIYWQELLLDISRSLRTVLSKQAEGQTSAASSS